MYNYTMPLTVKLPCKERKEEYSLFVNSKINFIHKDQKLGTLLLCEGCGVAFYSASNARRAIIFSELSENDFGLPLQEGNIPYFKQPVRILYKAKGRKIDLLKFMCHNLEEKYGSKIYKLGDIYWLTLGSYIDSLYGKHTGSNKRELYLLTEKHLAYLKRIGVKSENL